MKKSQLMSAVCAGVVTLLASVTANAAIIYDLDRTIGAGTVTGFIETDGTIGVLGVANITAWVLTLTDPSLNGGSPYLLDSSDTNARISVRGSALTASSTALSFDFDAAGLNYLFIGGNTQESWCIETGGCRSTELNKQESIGYSGGPTLAPRTGTVEIAVTAVPVPAAVWLFGSGLLGLVGMARRKAA